MSRLASLALFGLTTTSLFAAPQDWPRFRGPNGSGATEATGLPVEFGPQKGVRWKAEVPPSASSPVLTEESVFLTAADETSLSVLCLERQSGELRWRQDLERARTDEFYPENDSASPSPATDGENVYAFFPELGLVSYDAAGKERWVLPLGPFVSFYGMAGSPLVSGDSLVLLCDQQQGSFLISVDTATGKPRWRTEREGIVESWTTPVLFPTEKPEAVLVFGTYFVCGYSLENGEELWRMAGVGYTPVSSPIVDGTQLLVSVPHHAEQPMPSFETLVGQFDKNEDELLAKTELVGSPMGGHFGWADADKDDQIDAAEWAFVRAGMSSRDYGLVAIDLAPSKEADKGDGAEKVRETWRYKKALPSIATPLLYDGVVYLVKHGGIVTALDAATGEVTKQERLARADDYNASPVAADGKIYLAGDAGEVTVIEAGPEWTVLATNDLGEELRGTPAIGDGTLFVRTASALYCFQGSPAK